jgi:hypothetical protein
MEGDRMSKNRSRVPSRILLVIVSLAAGTSAAGIVACRGRDGAHSDGSAVGFHAGGTAGAFFQGIAVVQDHLWVTTELGVAVIDPVDETWTMLDLGSVNLRDTRVVLCGSDVWLLSRDSVALVNLKAKTIENRGVPRAYAGTAFCGSGALWLYARQDGTLFRFPASQSGTETYQMRAPGRSQYFLFVEALQNGVYFLAPQYSPGQPPEAGLFRFDPRTAAFDRVELPGGAQAVSLERTDEGLVVRTRDSSAFVLKAEGQPWREVPQLAKTPPPHYGGGGQPVLAQGDGVVWVGASYDVSPASYFVLRYIRDAMEPKDLVILPRDWYGGSARRAVQYLGMLWALLGHRVLRIDPEGGILVSYELTDSTGTLKKRSFPLAKDSTGVRFFDGDSVRQFSETPVTEPEPESPESSPESPDSSNLVKEPER